MNTEVNEEVAFLFPLSKGRMGVAVKYRLSRDHWGLVFYGLWTGDEKMGERVNEKAT